jgi:hypothetical protein
MPLCLETIKAFSEGAPIVTEFVSKLADTILWSSIGAAVLGLILKLIQTVGNTRLLACAEVRYGLPVNRK